METLVVIIYLFFVLLIGLWAGRGIKTMHEYALAGKSFGMLVIFATLSASFIGGGFSMGNAEKVFLVGISNIVALWGFSIKEILVARYIAPQMMRYPNAISVGDIMDEHYGKGARLFSGVFSLALCAGILGAQIGAMGYVFNLFLDVDRVWGVLIGCGIVIAYSTVGGMRSVVWTDIIQFIVLAFGIPMTLYFGLQHVGGWQAMQNNLPATHFTLPTEPLAVIALLSLFMTFMLGETLVPPYLQRLLIGKSSKDVIRGSLLSGLFSIPFFAITGLIGLVALAMQPSLDANLAMPYVIQQAVPPILQGIVAAAIVSIIMSSADSFLNSASIAFSNDIVRPLRKTPLTATVELMLARVVTLLVGIASMVFALSIDSVIDILIYAYNFWAPTVLVPLTMAILGCYVSRKRFIAGAVAGIGSAIVWNAVLQQPWQIDALVVGFFANLIAFTCVDRPAAKAAKLSDVQ
ncbi:MAG TPA: twin-arginine translocation pathway signal protein [Methylophaga sp.]|jgi:SSS family solute:Na+ symporter|uniref:sodium:solute symporter family protein n=1 Tax=unclassified Methylophaga TaxID=2629249 RepID=UPI000C925EDC|nr:MULTISPECIES: sodium:solute symporter family protein [unclassified Methylophaga]MAP27985.1 twin-arginine translocation pathway signal protein [Methylophaga sp.]HAD29960.1 twin-arginine translocation pathway signal protein [Methylophaga sp.]HBX59091.1 twin-arginine translocation pathway signal protein [Methylophaga sp.]HCO01621.1 twin-arginine translocation pathway signal protein [Methylophaga sp.]|tara:strand:- start:819 stop:2207 length:1389 start_codon:yes stop_codon:yes gene_type:complete